MIRIAVMEIFYKAQNHCKNFVQIFTDISGKGNCAGVCEGFGGSGLVVSHGEADGGNAQSAEFI
jgi:hypothetical protein